MTTTAASARRTRASPSSCYTKAIATASRWDPTTCSSTGTWRRSSRTRRAASTPGARLRRDFFGDWNNRTRTNAGEGFQICGFTSAFIRVHLPHDPFFFWETYMNRLGTVLSFAGLVLSMVPARGDLISPPFKTLTGHTGSVLSVRIAPDGKTLVSGARDNTIRIWDLASGKCTRTLTNHTGNVYSIVFSHDGKVMASGAT